MISRLHRLTSALDLATSAPHRFRTGISKCDVRRLSLGASCPAKWPRLGHTSVFFQNGLKICELPLVVKKVEDVLKIGESRSAKTNELQQGLFTLTYPQEMDPEISEILAGFNRCFTASGIFRLLETIPAEEVTPPVAIHALNKIINFEKVARLQQVSILPGYNKKEYLNDQKTPAATGRFGLSGISKPGESFLSFAFLNMLLDIVLRSRDPRIILEGLRVISQPNFPSTADQINSYKEKLYEETMVLVTEGAFSLVQICDAISILSTFYPDDKKQCHELVDKLWSGIMDKSQEINVDSIAKVFNTLPHLKQSRDIILKLLESKVGDFWRHYSTRDILEMLRNMTAIQFGSERVLKVTSQWLSVHKSNLKEEEFLAVVCCYSNLEYIDSTIVSTLERYMKMRGCKIKEKDLVGAICDYCHDFRVRSKPILEGAGEYLIEHGMNLSTPQIYSISRLYGELDFHPPNGFKFWEILEHVLEHKFVEFPPKEIVDLLLSFVYIERYPLNFVRKIFNPFFMERLHSQSESDIAHCRSQLKLFDVAMKQECPQYSGPYLPKDNKYQYMYCDHRVQRLANQLVSPLADVVGDVKRIGLSVVLSSLPLNQLYVIELMIYPSVAASFLRFGFRTNNSQNIAVLLHPPEHYDQSGQFLIGRQAMRKRQLIRMGFKVMEFKLEQLTKLRVHPQTLHQVLSKEYLRVIQSPN